MVSDTPAEMNLTGVPRSGTAGATGTTAVARIKDGAGATIVNGLTVGMTDGFFEVLLNSTAITT